MAKVGIIYATNSKMVRAHIVPDNDAQLDKWPLAAGESLLVVDRALIKSPSDLAAQVQLATGKAPADFVCAVVDPLGNVTDLIKADPTIDAPQPGTSLIAAPVGVFAGCTFDAKQNLFTIPAKTLPAYIDKETQQLVAAVDVPATTIAAVNTVSPVLDVLA